MSFKKVLYHTKTTSFLDNSLIIKKPSIYIMKKFTKSYRSKLYHVKTTSLMNDPLYHSDNHYIMQKLVISFTNSLYHAKSKLFYMLEHESQYILYNLGLSTCKTF